MSNELAKFLFSRSVDFEEGRAEVNTGESRQSSPSEKDKLAD